MYILGISAYYHDSAASIIKNGEIVAAAQEERFTRKKHDSGFPHNSIKYCISEAGILAKDIEKIVFYEKPFLKFERLLETYLAYAPYGFKSFLKALPIWIKEKLFQKSLITRELKKNFGNNENISHKLMFSDHHLSHASSAYFPSPFQSAAILTMDGVGEWTTTSVAIAKENKLSIIKEIHFPHSLGMLYSAFTYYTGFKVNSGEYKLMGLAPYGIPRYVELIKENLLNIAEDGSFQLNMLYFDYPAGSRMVNKNFEKLFGGPPRKEGSEITQRDTDLAASIQLVLEEIILKLAKSIAEDTGEKNLCLAGGVALNCIANTALIKSKIFDNIWVQPASGDAGGSIGAALSVWYLHYLNKREIKPGCDGMKGTYLGPEFSDKDVEIELKNSGAVFTKLNNIDLIEKVTDLIIDKNAVGWMQGRMEFGPRALGGRSIIADPRLPDMQRQLNLKIKFRESFRPFAPSILPEYQNDWYEDNIDSPYMLFISNIRKDKRLVLNNYENNLKGMEKLRVNRSIIPAVTHVDYSSRIQTIYKETNVKYYNLIKRFYEKTGCPLLINTSFNVRGEPIVCTPSDAFKCFMGTELDVLVINNFLLLKNLQNKKIMESYKYKYELD